MPYVTKYLIYNYNTMVLLGQERNEGHPKTSGAQDDDEKEQERGMRVNSMIGDVHCVRSSDMVNR